MIFKAKEASVEAGPSSSLDDFLRRAQGAFDSDWDEAVTCYQLALAKINPNCLSESASIFSEFYPNRNEQEAWGDIYFEYAESLHMRALSKPTLDQASFSVIQKELSRSAAQFKAAYSLYASEIDKAQCVYYQTRVISKLIESDHSLAFSESDAGLYLNHLSDLVDNLKEMVERYQLRIVYEESTGEKNATIRVDYIPKNVSRKEMLAQMSQAASVGLNQSVSLAHSLRALCSAEGQPGSLNPYVLWSELGTPSVEMRGFSFRLARAQSYLYLCVEQLEAIEQFFFGAPGNAADCEVNLARQNTGFHESGAIAPSDLPEPAEWQAQAEEVPSTEPFAP